MSIERELKKRSEEKCELCSSNEELSIFTVFPHKEASLLHSVNLCKTCIEQIENSDQVDVNHWRLLNDSIWNELDSIKVISWRMLDGLRQNGEGWATDLQDMMYMDDETTQWAKEGLPAEGAIVHKDSNGVILTAGDSVVLIKDLDVKGSSLTAKRGAAVRNIRLDPDNAEYIEGKVEGQTVVIITKYVKKI
ncbi:MAG: PhnA protein [Bacteroidetes bacterium]|nr:MAG: PhnA protein [Bacteroidota bacterium]